MPRSAKTVLGLEIGPRSVHIVTAVARGGRLKVKRADRLPVPDTPGGAATVLKRWWEEHAPGKTPCVLSVGGGRVLYQQLRMEDTDPREHAQVARMEALRLGEMTDAPMEVSATPASRDSGERRLLLAMSRAEALEDALRPVREAGADPVNLCPAPVALFNGLAAVGTPIEGPTLVADLGADRTEVVIGDAKGVRFARSFDLGDAHLDDLLARHLRLPTPQATRARWKCDRLGALPEGTDDLCRRFAEQWTREIEACLDMYTDTLDTEGEPGIRTAILAGEGADWPPMRGLLADATSLSISSPGRLPGVESDETAGFLIACGLAADGLGLAHAPASLLPASLRQRLERQRNKRHWTAAAVCTLAAMGVLVAGVRVSLHREQKRLQRHNATLQRSDALRRETETLQARKSLVEDMLAPLEDFVANSARVRELTLFIAEQKTDGDFLTFLGDSESYLQIRLDSAEDREQRALSPRDRLALKQLNRRRADEMRDARMNRLIVEGFTPRGNLSSVKTLIEALGARPDVARADLLSDDFIFGDPDRDPQWQSDGHRRFVLDLRLVPPREPKPGRPE